MRDEDWRGLDEGALERLLIERWLYRGLMLGVILLSAITATWLAARGVATLAEQVTVAVLLALSLAAAAVAFVMRRQDLELHKELRQRRRRSGP
jgi:hypothetical protein